MPPSRHPKTPVRALIQSRLWSPEEEQIPSGLVEISVMRVVVPWINGDRRRDRMKNKLAVLVVALLASMAAASLPPAIAQDNSSTNPASINAPVRSMVEL